MDQNSLGDRMKNYENVSRIHLTKKMPVIIRLDGKAFHTLTKYFVKPFDSVLTLTMQETANYLCANIMNCKMAYSQSDEISLLLIDNEKVEQESWVRNNLQKMVSISASMATLSFNKNFKREVDYLYDLTINAKFNSDVYNIYKEKVFEAMFDARAFILPEHEVCNYFIWRQQDATRNSIQMLAQSMFSHKELQNLNNDQLQEKMWQEKNINWNAISIVNKRGFCSIKKSYEHNEVTRHKWMTDFNIPIFTQNRNYIERFLPKGEDK